MCVVSGLMHDKQWVCRTCGPNRPARSASCAAHQHKSGISCTSRRIGCNRSKADGTARLRRSNLTCAGPAARLSRKSAMHKCPQVRGRAPPAGPRCGASDDQSLQPRTRTHLARAPADACRDGDVDLGTCHHRVRDNQPHHSPSSRPTPKHPARTHGVVPQHQNQRLPAHVETGARGFAMYNRHLSHTGRLRLLRQPRGAPSNAQLMHRLLQLLAEDCFHGLDVFFQLLYLHAGAAAQSYKTPGSAALLVCCACQRNSFF